MRKTTAIITAVLLAFGLTGCKAADQGHYNDRIESGTVCIDGYLYAWSAPVMRNGFDMEPTGQFCQEAEGKAAGQTAHDVLKEAKPNAA